MSFKHNTEWKFKCDRCGRVWRGSMTNDVIQCICEADCEYCGGVQTVTTVVTKSGLGVKEAWTSQLHEPDPWNTTHGPCSVCSHYQNRPIVYATPLDAEDDDMKEDVA